MINVRMGKIADIEAIVILGKQLCVESPAYIDRGFNVDKVKSMLAYMIGSETDVVLVAENTIGLVGYFLGGMTYEWFSEEAIAFDYSVYVTPAQRNGRTAIKLFQAFERWAKDKHIKRLQVGITTQINTQNNSRLYRYLGYEDGGVLFEKRL